MKNVTISMDERLLELTQSEAAKAGVSVSEYIADAVARMAGVQVSMRAKAQSEAMRAFLASPALHIAVNGKMPSATERNER